MKKLSTAGATNFYDGVSTTAGALDSTLLLAAFNAPTGCAAIATTASCVTTTKLYVVESTATASASLTTPTSTSSRAPRRPRSQLATPTVRRLCHRQRQNPQDHQRA